MTRVSEVLDLQVPGIANLGWGSRLHDFVSEYPADGIYNRYSRSDLTQFGIGPCARRDVVIAGSHQCYGYDVATHLNFCHGNLCAVHQFFHSMTDMNSHEYYSALDRIRRHLGASLGKSALQTRLSVPHQVSFRWGNERLHTELRSSTGVRRELSLAVNNPDVCSWCMYWG